MMDFYLKQLPDNTVTLITRQGQIIGKFDSPDEAEDIVLESHAEAGAHAQHTDLMQHRHL